MNSTAVFLIVLAVVIIVFLILREFWTWYWKINQIIQGQEETNGLLRELVNNHFIKETSDLPKKDEATEFDEETRKSFVNPNVHVIVIDSQTEGICTLTGNDWNNLISKDPKQKRYSFIKIQE